MKVRLGFVSNSSSSSFVGFGVLLAEEDLLAKLNLKKNQWDEYDDENIRYAGNGKYLLGEILAQEIEERETETFTIEELSNIQKEITMKYSVDVKDFSLIVGNIYD